MSSRPPPAHRPANDVTAGSAPDRADDAALAIALAATSGPGRPLTKELEGKLMASFRSSRARVGTSTTAAGTQTVDLDEALAAQSPLPRPRWLGGGFGIFAAAAAVLLALGVAGVSGQGVTGKTAATATQETYVVSLARTPDGDLVVRSSAVGEPRIVWVEVERAPGVFESLGSIRVGIETALPREMTSRLGTSTRLRLSASLESKSPLFDGTIPPLRAR